MRLLGYRALLPFEVVNDEECYQVGRSGSGGCGYVHGAGFRAAGACTTGHLQVSSLEDLMEQCNTDPAICATLIASYGAALVAAGASVDQLTALSNFAVEFSNGAGAAYSSAIAGAIVAVATQAANNPAHVGLASQMVAAATSIDPNADVGTVGQAPASPS